MFSYITQILYIIFLSNVFTVKYFVLGTMYSHIL